MGTLVVSQKFRILGFKKFFGLPGGFSLGVITPLHLIEVAGLISSDPSLVINDFHWMLWIYKIGLQLETFHINHFGGDTKAFLELGDMENIVDCR